MVRSLFVQSDRQKLSQCKRIGQPPRDAPLAIESFKETNHHDADVLVLSRVGTAERNRRRGAGGRCVDPGSGWWLLCKGSSFAAASPCWAASLSNSCPCPPGTTKS